VEKIACTSSFVMGSLTIITSARATASCPTDELFPKRLGAFPKHAMEWVSHFLDRAISAPFLSQSFCPTIDGAMAHVQCE
jgi:hypothetical protein